MVDKKGNAFYQTINVLVEYETDKGEKIIKLSHKRVVLNQVGGETLLTHYWQIFLSELSCILSHLYLIFLPSLSFYQRVQKSLKILCTSPPLGYDFNLLFINSLDTDPKWVRRSVIERKFKDQDGMPRDAPWDIDRPGHSLLWPAIIDFP